MNRIFLNWEDSPVLTPEAEHHLKKVLRLKPGSQIEVVNQTTKEVWLAEIASFPKINLLEKINREYSIPHITLIFSVCKGSHNDQIIEKCTELGVAKFIIYQAKNSIAKIKDNKLERLHKIAYAAACQSKRVSLPEICFADNLNQLPTPNSETAFICSLKDNAKTLNNYHLQSSNYIVAVGPEGDFTEEEYNFFESAGFLSLSLGAGVLRAETAAIMGVGVLRGFTLDKIH